MTARILTLDIETQRAIVETFSIWKPFIGIDHIIQPTRVLCFAAKWRGEDKMIFKAAWTDPWVDDTAAGSYLNMMQALFDLLSEADYVVTWNGDRFDLQWIESECGRLKLGRPAPYKSVDLIKTNKRWFKGGQMSMKLDWTSRQWLHDHKTKHGATDLWHDIRYGTRAEKRAAQALMKEYNIHDTELTEQILELYLPWTNINLALHVPDDGLLRCTKCSSENVRRKGFKATLAGVYQQYVCRDCGSWSRGHRRLTTTELRPVV
jgi:hypothetical protein